MAEKLLTPKYLTAQLVKQAVDFVWQSVSNSYIGRLLLKRQECHIVVLVPGMEDGRVDDYAKWPDYPLHPVAIYSDSRGDPTKWTVRFDNIAMCKALQLWQGRNDDQTDVMRHLLFSGNAVYWGGVKRHGIVVACSGVQPWFDKMISGMIADVIFALAHNDWETHEDRKGKDFLD